MKKGINKNVFTIVVLLGLLALLAAYFLGYKKYTDLAATTTASNVTLQKTVDDLKVHYVNKAQYEAEMGPMKEGILAIMDKYPADTRVEDLIMHAVYTQNAVPVKFSSINVGDKEVFSTVSKDTVLATAQEDLQNGISFVEQKGTYVNELNYESLKQVVQQIFDSEYNMGIRKIAYTLSEDDGTLSGTLDLSFYCMYGNGKTYEVPDMTPYINGTGNIFGVVTMPVFDEEGNLVIEEVEEATTEGAEDVTTEPAA